MMAGIRHIHLGFRALNPKRCRFEDGIQGGVGALGEMRKEAPNPKAQNLGPQASQALLQRHCKCLHPGCPIPEACASVHVRDPSVVPKPKALLNPNPKPETLNPELLKSSS